MTSSEYEKITSLLRTVFPKVPYLEDDDSSAVFFNILNRYNFEDVKEGVKACIELEKFAPPIATVRQYIENAEHARNTMIRNAAAAERKSMTVKCTRCNDAGFMWLTFEDGTEVVSICDCEEARIQNPWYFMTDGEYKKAMEYKRKRGQNPESEKPGHSFEWWTDACGKLVSIRPGRKAPGKIVRR